MIMGPMDKFRQWTDESFKRQHRVKDTAGSLKQGASGTLQTQSRRTSLFGGAGAGKEAAGSVFEMMS